MTFIIQDHECPPCFILTALLGSLKFDARSITNPILTRQLRVGTTNTVKSRTDRYSVLGGRGVGGPSKTSKIKDSIFVRIGAPVDTSNQEEKKCPAGK